MTLRTDYANATILDDVHPAAHNDTNAAANALDARVAALEDVDATLSGIEDRAVGLDLAVGVATFDRAGIAGNNGINNNRPYMGVITAPAAMTVTRIRTYTGTTAAAPTPTNIELGVYREETDKSFTLLQRTANLSGVIWTAPDTAYEPALQAPVALTAGARYALAVLISTTFATPTLPAATLSMPHANAENLSSPVRAAYRTPNVANLPATMPVANLSGVWIPYLVALP